MEKFDTRAVRSGQTRTQESEHNDAIFLTSSFVFASARQAAARFAHEEEGNVYSRFTNPTVRTFEERLAALEGARHCIGTSSGMSEILLLLADGILGLLALRHGSRNESAKQEK
jgi:O-succinylhomoserine sulfhydrylase